MNYTKKLVGSSNKMDNKTTLNFSIDLLEFSTSAHLQFKTFTFPRATNILNQWHMGSTGLGKETIDFGDSGCKLDPENGSRPKNSIANLHGSTTSWVYEVDLDESCGGNHVTIAFKNAPPRSIHNRKCGNAKSSLHACKTPLVFLHANTCMKFLIIFQTPIICVTYS